MTLPAMHWRRLPVQTPATSFVSDVLAAVNAAFTSATYYDGTARTPGSGSAWTATTEASPIEAVRLRPPYVSSIGAAVMYCGKSVAPPSGPTWAFPDAGLGWVNSHLMIGTSKGPIGATTNWYLANPWTTDTFFGLWRVCACAAVNIVAVHAYECEEVVKVIFVNSSGGAYWSWGSAFLDPEIAYVPGSLAVESDGRLYGQGVTGSSTACSGDFNVNPNTPAPGTWGGSAGTAHVGVFVPGAGTIRQLHRNEILRTSSTATLLGEDGTPILTPINLHNNSTARWAGRMREICYATDGKQGSYLRKLGVDYAYRVSAHMTVDYDAWALKY